MTPRPASGASPLARGSSHERGLGSKEAGDTIKARGDVPPTRAERRGAAAPTRL